MAPDALIASHMNVGPGGQQPKMHDTVWGPDKTPQKMVLPDGRPNWCLKRGVFTRPT